MLPPLGEIHCKNTEASICIFGDPPAGTNASMEFLWIGKVIPETAHQSLRTTRRSRAGAARGAGTPCATSRASGSAASTGRTFLQNNNRVRNKAKQYHDIGMMNIQLSQREFQSRSSQNVAIVHTDRFVALQVRQGFYNHLASSRAQYQQSARPGRFLKKSSAAVGRDNAKLAWSPVRTLPVAPLSCDLGCSSRTVEPPP